MASGRGKKGAVNEPKKADPFLAQNLDYQAPGRAVGITVMLSLVAFTAAFMSYQSLQLGEATSPASESSALSEAKEHFALPGDPLWGFVSIPAGEFIMAAILSAIGWPMRMSAGRRHSARAGSTCQSISLAVLRSPTRNLLITFRRLSRRAPRHSQS